MSKISLLIATRNTHKAGEIRAILGDCFQFLTLNNFPNAPVVVEDAPTFAGNATKKATELAKWIGSKPRTPNLEPPTPNFILADDSGLEVDALNGAPGVHSARFATLDRSADGSSANSSDMDNNTKLLRLLKSVRLEKRAARFHCVLALAPVENREPKVESASPVCYANEWETPVELFEGICEGRILFEPHGQNGFGYDPLFVPDGFEQTFAELGADAKNKLSHRGQALVKLKRWLELRR